MNINEALSNRNIDRMIELSEIAKEKFGKEYYSSRVKKNYNSSYDGVVETRTGEQYRVKVRHDGSLTTTNWKRI